MAARFPIAPYGPIHLRRLLRARMDPGERLVGFSVVQLRPPPALVIAQVVLALIPGIGQVAAFTLAALGSDQRRLLVLTTRRMLLLRLNRSSPDPRGRGIVADLPLATLLVDHASASERAQPAEPPARARSSRRARKPARATTFTVTDALVPRRIAFILPRTSSRAAARLRDALVVLAENPPSLPPYNHRPHTPAGSHAGSRTSPLPTRRDGILGRHRAAMPRPLHPRAVGRRIHE